MHYRRAKTPGATYFFTLVTHQRHPIFQHPDAVELLRQAFRSVKHTHPFTIEAIVILPDHLHCLWTLPPEDADFSNRWRLIKSRFTRCCPAQFRQQRSTARQHKGEQAVWQRRFWEHQIADEADFAQHCDYIHYNPVHHGLVKAPKEWAYSSFHRAVRWGMYTEDWGADSKFQNLDGVGKE
ncbi:MAG: transposase [Tildeniella nuda ZEHNDER 1965/U140]|jgi:putative transposase|nr:transposase [Tildeniella nuda ZEHNDER 1965/U140]